MPFKRENYSQDWEQIRARVLQRDGHRCAECGLKNYTVGWRYRNGEFGVTEFAESYAEGRRLATKGERQLGWKHTVIVLTISHTNHDTTDNRDENLKSLCQYHHLKHDSYHHVETRRTKKQKGQGELFDGRKDHYQII